MEVWRTNPALRIHVWLHVFVCVCVCVRVCVRVHVVITLYSFLNGTRIISACEMLHHIHTHTHTAEGCVCACARAVWQALDVMVANTNLLLLVAHLLALLLLQPSRFRFP